MAAGAEAGHRTPGAGRALVLADALLDELALPAALLAGDALPAADLALVVVRAPAAVEAAVPAPAPRVRSHRLMGSRLQMCYRSPCVMLPGQHCRTRSNHLCSLTHVLRGGLYSCSGWAESCQAQARSCLKQAGI